MVTIITMWLRLEDDCGHDFQKTVLTRGLKCETQLETAISHVPCQNLLTHPSFSLCIFLSLYIYVIMFLCKKKIIFHNDLIGDINYTTIINITCICTHDSLIIIRSFLFCLLFFNQSVCSMFFFRYHFNDTTISTTVPFMA